MSHMSFGAKAAAVSSIGTPLHISTATAAIATAATLGPRSRIMHHAYPGAVCIRSWVVGARVYVYEHLSNVGDVRFVQWALQFL